MSDELDLGLRRLFAETSEHPADEAFVAGVTAVTSRERRLMLLLRPLAAGLLLAVVLGALATGLGFAINQSRGVIASVVSAPTIGWAAGLALVFAAVVCVRAIAPLVRLTRP